MKALIGFQLIIAVLLISCEKENPLTVNAPPPASKLVLKVKYHVDGDEVLRDSILYANDSGNEYSIHNVLYYLSKIRIINSDGKVIHLKDVHYFDCYDPATNEITFKNIPDGNYTAIHFYIGINPDQNHHDSLPTTVENLNMEWPDLMGGGFHFLRLEGYFNHAGSQFGYAMHTGTNDCLIPVKMEKTFTIGAGERTAITIKMNINEWFRNPHSFDFNTDGNYIMGDLPAMLKISQNGKDVFTF